MKYKITLIIGIGWMLSGDVFSQQVTYSDHIATIIYNKCTSCHRPGEIAPFSLTNYSQVSSWAPMIAYVTGIRYMPPWKADPEYNDYLRENYLSDDEIQLIAQWVEDGTPQGNPENEPELPVFPVGSQIGDPDLVVSFSESYLHRGINKDVYRYFAIPTGLTEDKDLIGLELRPGNNTIVHHALVWEDVTGQAAALDAADPEYGYDPSQEDVLNTLNDQLPGYVPGQRPVLYTHGIAQKLHKDSYLKIQMHYAPSPIDQKDSTSINLFFAKDPATRFVKSHVMIPFLGTLTNGPFFILPNQVRTFHGVYTFEEDVTLLNITPHMHYLGKVWDVIAIKPSGDTVNLIRINDWDFDWQGSYSFRRPVILPEGTEVHARATYDNTSNNPYNPSHPPKLVTWGERTEDEMYYLPFSWVSYQPGDEDIDFGDELVTSLTEKGFYQVQNELYPVYPNPANGEVKIGYTLNSVAKVSLYIMDQQGKPVQYLYRQAAHFPGLHTVPWSVSNVVPGVYIVVLESGEETHTQKLIIR